MLTDTGTHRTTTKLQPLRNWRLAPAALERMVRRLKRLQQIVAEPSHHQHYLVIFFGTLRFEGQAPRRVPDTLTSDMCIAEDAHPRARQMQTDLEAIMEMESLPPSFERHGTQGPWPDSSTTPKSERHSRRLMLRS